MLQKCKIVKLHTFLNQPGKDPIQINLLALYRRLDQEGRRRLPGLRLDSVVGVAEDRRILIAVRDTGSFMDPRTAKDWWQDVVRARRAGLTFP